MLEEFEAIVSREFSPKGWDVWEGVATMIHRSTYDPTQGDEEVIRVRLRNKRTGLKVTCHLCDCHDKWTLEGAVWVCEHTYDYKLNDLVQFCPHRIVSSVKAVDVYIEPDDLKRIFDGWHE